MITHDLNHDLILIHTQSIVCATVDSLLLEYLEYITLKPVKILEELKKNVNVGWFNVGRFLN